MRRALVSPLQVEIDQSVNVHAFMSPFSHLGEPTLWAWVAEGQVVIYRLCGIGLSHSVTCYSFVHRLS